MFAKTEIDGINSFSCWCKLSFNCDFQNRLAIAAIRFSDRGKVHFGFKKKQTADDVLYELDRLEQTGGGSSSLIAGVETALYEIYSYRRYSARLVIIIFSNGHNKDIRQFAQVNFHHNFLIKVISILT